MPKKKRMMNRLQMREMGGGAKTEPKTEMTGGTNFMPFMLPSEEEMGMDMGGPGMGGPGMAPMEMEMAPPEMGKAMMGMLRRRKK